MDTNLQRNDELSENMGNLENTERKPVYSQDFENPEQNPEYSDEKPIIVSGARASAIRILSRFERSDSYIDKLLDYEFKHGSLSVLDKGLLNELVHGVIRWKAKLDWVLVGFYHGDYLKCLNIVKNAMRVALYQIIYLDRIPIPAAINESVEIVKRVQGDKTAGIVNGVLRNISRNLDNIRYPEREEDFTYYLSVMFSHPRWMVKRWLERFGEIKTEKLLYVNNRRPYNIIRVNKLKATNEQVEEVLKQHEMHYFESQYFKDSYLIKSNKPEIPTLDMFKEGWITIQDTSASLAAYLARPKEGWTVLDLCAAPGGKSFFLAEQMNDNGKVMAVDQYKSKLTFIDEGAQRLGLKSITSYLADATNLELEEQVDLVFADVPCSGLGTLSKKPDIKWKREREDILVLADMQKKILDAAVRLLKPGGVLIYSTCTIEPEENEENIKWFLEKYPQFEIDPADNYLPQDVCKNGFMEILPHIHYIDGAFAARLIKKQ
jgi:16S rRNA (cytosine967-C5)-methyltransferase